MPAHLYFTIEMLLFDYARGLHTSRYVQRTLEGMGFKANLRGSSHIIDIFSLADGHHYEIIL